MRRPVAVAAVVIVTLATAALATSAGDDGADLTLPATDLRLQRVTTAVFAVVVVLGVASLALIRPAVVSDEHPRPRRSLRSTLAVILLAVVFATVLDTVRGADAEDETGTRTATVDDRPDAATDELVVEPRRVATALLTLLAVGALVAVAARSRRSVPRDRSSGGADELATVVRDGRAALEEVASRGEPREAILACWRALETELTAHDRPRRHHETGAEYLRRALAPLGPSPTAVDELATLVELARWSTNPLGEADVAAARLALDEVLDGIVVRTRG